MTSPNISLSFYTFRNCASKPPWKFSDSTRNLYDLWTTGIMDFGIFFELAHYRLRIDGSTFIVDFTIHTVSWISLLACRKKQIEIGKEIFRILQRRSIQCSRRIVWNQSKSWIKIEECIKYRVSYIETYFRNWLWEIEIHKLEFVWRWFWNPEVWMF